MHVLRNSPFLPLNLLVSDQPFQHLGQAASTQGKSEATSLVDRFELRFQDESSKVLDKGVRVRE